MIKKSNHNSNSLKNGDDKKNANGKISDGRDIRTDILKDNDQSEAKTQQFSHDQLKDSIVGYTQKDGGKTDSVSASKDYHFRTPEKSPYRPLLVILVVVVVCFLALIIYQMVRTHKNTLVLKKATELSSQEVAESELLKYLDQDKPRIKEKEELKRFAFSNDIFHGMAPLRSRKEGPVISKNQDPELAAIVDALNIRSRMMFGVKIKKKGNVITETCNGTIRGFKINSNKAKESGELIQDEITLFTPSRGIIKIKNSILESVSRTSYDEILKDLESSAIIHQKRIVSRENILQIQLRFGDRGEKKSADGFLIFGDRVGDIKLGMGITEMKSILSTKYRVLRRKIMVGNRFETILKIDDRKRIPLFFIYERNEKIWGIDIVNDRYRTGRGIGIGSTLGMVRIFYTNINIVSIIGKITYLFIGDSEKKNIKFILADDNRIDFNKEVFPFDIKINSILIGKSPYLK